MFESSSSEVLVGPVVPSTIASSVEEFSTGTVDQLLFREEIRLSIGVVLDGIGSLDGTSCGEGPA